MYDEQDYDSSTDDENNPKAAEIIEDDGWNDVCEDR